jgi:hypothetical protein
VSQPLSFAPLQNGLDYLESVVEHLRDNPDQRDLKYAILHLQAATECASQGSVDEGTLDTDT